MSDFIGIYKNAAPDDYCQRMIERWEELDLTTASWKGEESNLSVQNRKDFSFMYEREDEVLARETNKILNDSLVKYIDAHPSLGMQSFYSRQVKVQKTPPKGGFHLWHSEHANTEQAVARCLTWTIYLNDIKNGEGEIEFLEFGKKLQPEKGMIVFFPASWTHTHRGNPVYSQDKYIATGWYYLHDV